MHLPQCQIWGHMVSSFEFSNHIVICHSARPHESIPLPRSSQCHAPPWCTPINQSHRPDPASVAFPWCATTNQSHRPDRLRDPITHPHKSMPSPRSSVVYPHGTSPSINPITPVQPVSHAPMERPHKSHSHHPDPASVACPHESIPLPWSSQCHVPPWHIPPNQSHHPDPVVHPHDASL